MNTRAIRICLVVAGLKSKGTTSGFHNIEAKVRQWQSLRGREVRLNIVGNSLDVFEYLNIFQFQLHANTFYLF